MLECKGSDEGEALAVVIMLVVPSRPTDGLNKSVSSKYCISAGVNGFVYIGLSSMLETASDISRVQ